MSDIKHEMVQVMDSRRVLVNTLDELSETDKNILLVTCDVGMNYITDQNKFKSLNLGVTEVSSSVIASALAMSGFTVVFYSMIPFVTFRVHESIRNCTFFHDSKVIFAGVKGGPSYKMLGHSHNLLNENEDVYMMSQFMKCYTPKNNDEVKEAILEAYKSDKASYIRLG